MTEPGWVEHAIWWHVYPLGFTGADVSGADRSAAGGLDHLVRWLDHAVQLGVSGLALGPVFESAGHGYDTVDPFRIDSRLGDDAGFDRLVAAAHDRGLRVLLDGVFNHVGRGFARFAGGHPDGDDADWFVRAGDGFEVFEGHEGLITLNHRSSAVADHVVAVMVHWLDRGADGWRLDAAYAVDPAFWARVLPRVRAAHLDAYVVGEVIHGDYPAVVVASGMDTITQYELWKAVWSSLDDANLFELAHALQRHDVLLDTFVPFTFVGNHDVTRIASRITDGRHLAHAAVLLLTLPGTPAVYYGDEQGQLGVKEERVGGDDAVRPAFPESPVPLTGTAAELLRLHQDLIGLRRRHAWLHGARIQVVTNTNTTMTFDVVGEGGSLRVLLNLDDAAFPHAADGDVLAGTAHRSGGDVVVDPHGWAVVGA